MEHPMRMAFIKIAFCILLLSVCALSVSAQASSGFTQLATNVTATTFTDSGCANGTTCEYQVIALDTFGDVSTPAVPASGTNNFVVGTIPNDGKAHTVTLSWIAGANDVSYQVYRRVLQPSAPTGFAATVN